MLRSFEFEGLLDVAKVVEVNVHVVAAGAEQPPVVRRESHFFGGVAMVGEDVDGFGEISEVPQPDGLVGRGGDDVLLVFVEIQAQNLGVVCAVAGDVRLGQSVVPKFEQAVSSAGSENFFGSGVPLHLIAIFYVGRQGKQQLAILGCAHVHDTVEAASDKQRIFVSAFN